MVKYMAPKYRLPFLLLGMLSLVTGVTTGLARFGISMPEMVQSASGFHSAFMISAFFGTLIGLERAVATRYLWAYFAPLCSGLGGLLLLLPTPISFSNHLAPGLIMLAGAVFTAASTMIVIQQKALFTITLWIAAALWFLGNFLWFLSDNFWVSIPFGLCFLVFTIAGERLELTRFMPPRKSATGLFIALLVIMTLGSLRSGMSSFTDNTLLGLGFAGLALWLFQFDIARKTIRQTGITRFVACCLLSGYFWLLIGGLLLTPISPADFNAYQRDAAVHAVALGFVFSMVIGHAPIIFPAIMRVAIPFNERMYMPLALLHLGVAIRIMGDLLPNAMIRTLGGTLNALALLAFILTLLIQVRAGHRKN